MLLVDRAEVVWHVNRRLDSRDWWCFLTHDIPGATACERIERKFYTGDAAADFELLMGLSELGLVGVFLANKRRLSAERLHPLVRGSIVPPSVADLRQRDILVLTGDARCAHALALWFGRFLGRMDQDAAPAFSRN